MGRAVKDWLLNDFETKKYELHIKTIIRNSIEFYFKYWKDWNEKSHDSPTNRVTLIK